MKNKTKFKRLMKRNISGGIVFTGLFVVGYSLLHTSVSAPKTGSIFTAQELALTVTNEAIWQCGDGIKIERESLLGGLGRPKEKVLRIEQPENEIYTNLWQKALNAQTLLCFGANFKPLKKYDDVPADIWILSRSTVPTHFTPPKVILWTAWRQTPKKVLEYAAQHKVPILPIQKTGGIRYEMHTGLVWTRN